ncbi:MAG TPA: 50S ribosomal protein L35 [bacterium]|jgi:large subunit ribosomal protein L35|nr:50S ribosomal protein L35 [bacterium]
MPKLKTHQGTAKRIHVTARKRLLRGRQLGGHLMVGKSPKRRRSLRERREVDQADRARIAGLLPYR